MTKILSWNFVGTKHLQKIFPKSVHFELIVSDQYPYVTAKIGKYNYEICPPLVVG